MKMTTREKIARKIASRVFACEGYDIFDLLEPKNKEWALYCADVAIKEFDKEREKRDD